ncbi:MAG: hypothetical protein ACYCQI_13595 [Gammaproteobacteria bacterium]
MSSNRLEKKPKLTSSKNPFSLLQNTIVNDKNHPMSQLLTFLSDQDQAAFAQVDLFAAKQVRKSRTVINFKPVIPTKSQDDVLYALNALDEPINFPVRGNWRPLLANLWGFVAWSVHGDCIHLFDIKNQRESIFGPANRDRNRYVNLGIGVLDDYIVIVTSKGRLEFWKYQDNQMVMTSSFKLNLKSKENLSFHSVSIQRLTPNHISLVADKNYFEPYEIYRPTVFVIDMTSKTHEAYRADDYTNVVILPSKFNPLKHYMLLHEHGLRIKVVEINFGRRWSCGWSLRWPWSWFKNKGVWKGASVKAISSSHIARLDLKGPDHSSASVYASTRSELFEITEEDGGIIPQLMTTIHSSYTYEQSRKFDNKIALFKNWFLYKPQNNLYLCASFSNSKLYKLAEANGVITDRVYDLSNDEIGIISQEKTLTRYESPESQFQKISAFLLFAETFFPKPLASICAQYAFGFFAQDKMQEAKEIDRRNEELATRERIKEEAKGCQQITV